MKKAHAPQNTSVEPILPEGSGNTCLFDPRRQGLIGVVSMFAGGNLISALLRTIGGFLAARLIDPATLGLFNGIGLSRQYAQFLQIGVGPGMNREVAFSVGSGNHRRVLDLSSTALFYLLSAGLLVSVALAGVGVWLLAAGSRLHIVVGWWTFAAVVPLTFLETYMLGLFRVFDRFGRLATARIVRSILLLVGLVFVYFFGFYGLCLRLLVSSILFMALLWRWCPLKVRPAWGCSEFKELLSTGLPIWGAAQLGVFWDVVNSTLILRVLGPQGFGLFAIARLGAESLRILPSALQQVLQPRSAAYYGKSGDLLGAYRSLLTPAFIVGLAFLPVAAAAWILLPPFVGALLPKYVGGVQAAQWILVVVALQNFRSPVSVLAAVAKRQRFNVAGLTIGFATYLLVLVSVGSARDLQLASFVQAYAAGRAIDVIASHALAERFLGRHGHGGVDAP